MANNTQSNFIVKQHKVMGQPQKVSVLLQTKADIHGSDVMGASINFVNCIVGAGCIGFGAAMAKSGGLMSIFMMIVFAYLNKLSFDLLIGMTSTDNDAKSFEGIGTKAYGRRGRLSVVVCKGAFTFGALVALMVVVRDNFAPSMRNILDGRTLSTSVQFLFDEVGSTIFLCTTLMLPLCLLRDISGLERFSVVKIGTFFLIIFTILYLKITTSVKSPEGSFAKHWLEVRAGCFQSMGTIVFTFMAQHTAHIVYQSLRSDLRNLSHWKKVSNLAMSLSFLLCLPVGLFAYTTFWDQTTSNLFELYAPSLAVDFARIMLCVTIVLTYPPPFFSFRELLIELLFSQETGEKLTLPTTQPCHNETEPLLSVNSSTRSLGGSWSIPLYQHVALTAIIWGVTLLLAITAPSLGDVLNLSGCAFGTAIAFILPALFSFRLQGFSWAAFSLLVVGGFVGSVGTYQSLLQLLRDFH